MTALVLGAGGFLGLNLVDALVAAGLATRCGRRARGNVLALRERRAVLVAADLETPAELRAAMTGCDVVFHLAGHYPRLSLDGDVALATGVRQMLHVLDAAAAAGVRRLVYVSSTATVAAAPSGPSDERHRFRSAPGFGTYHDLKWAMESLADAETRLEVITVCPAACLGPWDLRVGTSALIVATARGLDPPHPDGNIALVDVRDVAEALLRVALHPAPPRRLVVAAENHRLQPLLEELARRYRRPAPRAALAAAEAVALADAEEARVHGTRARPALFREIVDLVVHGVPLSSRLAERTLGLRWRPLAETLDAYDAWARRMHILPAPAAEAPT